MRKRTVWALCALTSLGAVAAGLNHRAMADAGVHEESPAPREEAESSDAAAPVGGGPETSATPSEEACPTTDAAKLNMVLRALHRLNQSEIATARLAEEQSRHEAVKEFARRMIADHSEADRKLSEFAKKNGISLTAVTPIDPIHAAMHEAMKASGQALKSSQGDAFDAAYIGLEISEHRFGVSAVAVGQKYATGDAKKLLDENHRMLQGHLEHAERLGQRLRFEPMPIGGGPVGGGSEELKEKEPAPAGDAGETGEKEESPGGAVRQWAEDAGGAIQQWAEDAGEYLMDAGRQLFEGDGGGEEPLDVKPPPIDRGH